MTVVNNYVKELAGITMGDKKPKRIENTEDIQDLGAASPATRDRLRTASQPIIPCDILFRAINQKISKNISKLINKGIGDSGLSISIKGKTQLINNPPNIKKVTLKPIA